jgi:hypothetical protein
MCSYEGKVDWYAYSEPSKTHSSGIAEFSIIWNPATNRIVAEKGKVIKADKKAKTPSRIIADYKEENGLCRGGSGGSVDTLDACDRRDRIAKMLERAGWCHGKIGEPENTQKWHRCEFTSIHSSTPG